MLLLSSILPSYVAILIAAIVAALLGGDGQMTTDLHTLVLIILCGVVTLLIRVIPFVMISRVNLLAIVIKWLSFIPITLFTALIIDGVIQQHDHAFGYTLNFILYYCNRANCDARYFHVV